MSGPICPIPPALVCVVVTPFWFFSDFQALPVLALYPPASSPLLHTTRPRMLVTQLACAFEENSINVNNITVICISISSYKVSRKVVAYRHWLKTRSRNCYLRRHLRADLQLRHLLPV